MQIISEPACDPLHSLWVEFLPYPSCVMQILSGPTCRSAPVLGRISPGKFPLTAPPSPTPPFSHHDTHDDEGLLSASGGGKSVECKARKIEINFLIWGYLGVFVLLFLLGMYSYPKKKKKNNTVFIMRSNQSSDPATYVQRMNP